LNSMSLYQPRQSLIHRIDPISKIFYILAAVAVPFILPTVTVAVICLLVSAVILLLAKVFRKVIPLVGFSMVILLSVVVIQGLFMAENKIPLFRLGPLIFYQEGLSFALGLSLRVLNIISAFAILVLTTKPSDLIESLVRKGLSPKIGYVLSSVLQIIPQMTATMGTIMDAQRSRGMETEGKLAVRLKAFFPLIGPVVMNSLINTRERAMALEVRGFNSPVPKTFLNQEFKSAYSKIIQWTLILIIIMALVWRILGWLK
jgi:energy-coupling factor transport system permease protein